jgi:flagellar hook-associated protein 2
VTTTSATSSTPSVATTSTSSSSSSTSSSSSSLGQTILSSLNAGAGIDTSSLIANLTAAQKASLEGPITTKQATNTAQISAAASISSDLTSVASAIHTLISGGSLQSQPASSVAGVMTVAAVPGQAIGSLATSMTVNQLAMAQSIKSAAVPSAQTFATGTLSLTVGTSGTPININIDSSNNTLAGIAASINGQNAGVTANVITGSDGTSTLVLKGQTGQAQSFSLSSTDNGDGASLSALNYGGGATGGMSLTQAAQDASVTVDGVTVTRASNSFSDVIPGVSMTLTGVGTTNLSSSLPTDAITSAVGNFVDVFNQLMTELNTATASATSGGTAGPLQGNTAIRALKNQLAQLTTTKLNANGAIGTLAQLGITTASDGTLSVNSTMLSNVMASNPSDVESMFMTSQSSSSSRVLITSKAGSTPSGVYTITNVTTAANGNNATGTINGVPMTASSWNLTSPTGAPGAGLGLQVLSGSPSTVTITINQGLDGAFQAISDALLGTTGQLTSLQSSLTTQQQSLATALTKADAQVQVYNSQLVTKFTQMNTLVSGYKATQSYLTQQVDLWTKSTD